jgi:hypothetical protein
MQAEHGKKRPQNEGQNTKSNLFRGSYSIINLSALQNFPVLLLKAASTKKLRTFAVLSFWSAVFT